MEPSWQLFQNGACKSASFVHVHLKAFDTSVLYVSFMNMQIKAVKL